MFIETDHPVTVASLRIAALAEAGLANAFTNLIDGKAAVSINTFEVMDPATGDVLASVPDIDRAGIDKAFAAARRAFHFFSPLLESLEVSLPSGCLVCFWGRSSWRRC